MKLYHGSNVKIENIDLLKCHPFKDFGRGFYLTTIKQQAWDMAKRTSDIEHIGKPFLMTYDFENTGISSLNIKEFDGVTDSWAEMIMNNRNRSFRNFDEPLFNGDNKYDIVFGPVANDNISRIFALYTQGVIRYDQLKNELEFKELNNQYSFHTNSAIALLKLIATESK
jgi:hypothetical protein